MTLTTAHLDYIQRTKIEMDMISIGPWTSAPPDLRRLWRIRSVGRTERQTSPPMEEKSSLPTADFLAGMHGYGFPLAYLIKATPVEISLAIGSWQVPQNPNAAPITLDTHSNGLRRSLAALYPSLETEPIVPSLLRSEFSGLVIGIPNLGKSDRIEQTVPLDRLIRALHGTSWNVLILAEPVMESTVRSLRRGILRELRGALAEEKAEGVPSPLTSHYAELLNSYTNMLTKGLSLGIWRTAVYLMSDEATYYLLESVWRSVFAGEESVFAPLTTGRSSEISKLAVQWSMPDIQGSLGPAGELFRHPFKYQTLLTSHQLSTYIHFPEKETSGFAIKTIPNFDVVRNPPNDQTPINLGEISVRGQPAQTNYAISADSLTGHAFIAGVTGSGKTTTIFHLLKEADRLGKPFLVIEPAKTEYRGLLNDPILKEKLQIFTLGNENISPFRLNPFEKSKETPISVHLELLRSVFIASFGLWQPLPQVLEICIHAVYRDRGWDLTRNSNKRIDQSSPRNLAFPTLTDLVNKVEEVTPTLGYDQKIASDIKAALVTRINSLRVGGKGRMLDTQVSIPIEFILGTPTILELEDMGDDDDKAFMMGLILIRVIEQLRDEQRSDPLKYLLVLEEAHRLLTNVSPSGNPEQASPRAKAVETFTNLLSEVRAYGLGIIIADQIPVKLIPDVIKNTNLKIAHRIVAEDDRAVLAGAMTMDQQQMRALSLLQPGEAAVFSQGDDAPILVRVKNAKPPGAWPDADSVKALRSKRERTRSTSAIINPNSQFINVNDPLSEPARAAALVAAESEDIRRSFTSLVTAVVEDIGRLKPLWALLAVEKGRRFRTKDVNETWLQYWMAIEITNWFASFRGRQNEWKYSEQQKVNDLLRSMLLNHIYHPDDNKYQETFRAYWRQIHLRTFDPLRGCSSICLDKPSLCLYRNAVVEVLDRNRDEFMNSLEIDQNQGAARTETWQHCRALAENLVPLRPGAQPAINRFALCYVQHQMLEKKDEESDRLINRFINDEVKGGLSDG